jgi:hypothetical protein
MIKLWLLQHVDPDWKVAHKLWSLRIAFVWMLVCGVYMALPAFQNYIDAFWFAGICIAFTFAIGIGRLTNQPGIS